jgi:hypothetical protein
MPTALADRVRGDRSFFDPTSDGIGRLPGAADNSLSWNTAMLCRKRIGQTSCLQLKLSEARILWHWTTELVVQPELILAVGRPMELKAGPSFELVPTSSYAIRVEITLLHRFLHPLPSFLVT